MIKFSQLPERVLNKIPELVSKLAELDQIMAFYFFGSGSRDQLKPLSDLDFAVLLTNAAADSFDFQMDLIGIISETLGTDEFDLVILNKAPIDFAFNIIDQGKLMHLSSQETLVDFIENTSRLYLDYHPKRQEFDRLTMELFRKKYAAPN
jgi:predicted nucleotidyltransferase